MSAYQQDISLCQTIIKSHAQFQGIWQSIVTTLRSQDENKSTIYNEVIKLIRDNNLSRREAWGLLSLALEYVNPSAEFDDDITSMLANLVDSIEGYLAPSAIMRFQGDPEDIQVFKEYVASRSWVHTNYYNAQPT